MHWASLGVVLAAAVLADRLTQALLHNRVAVGDAVRAGEHVVVVHLHNTGAVFGLFAGTAAAVAGGTAAVVLGALLLFARGGARHPIIPAGTGLLIGGTLANMIDRLRLGHVTDFLNVYASPAFNLADVLIIVGSALVLFGIITREPLRRPIWSSG